MRAQRLVRGIAAAAALAGLAATPAKGQQFHRQGFEGKEPVLRLGLTDGQVRLIEHGFAVEPDLVHGGKQAERVVIQTTSGTFCFLEYPVEKTQVFDELSLSVWVNASRPGTQLAARVVLPRAVDPRTREPLTTLLRGDKYEVAGRWRRLMLRRPDLLLGKQQQLLQAQRKEKVDIRGAYIDLVLLDIHGGIGDDDVRIDDLQVGPLVPATLIGPDRAPAAIPLNLKDEDGNTPPIVNPAVREQKDKSVAQVTGSQLRLGGRPFFMIGIRRSNAPLSALREAGINTVFLEWPADPSLLEEAGQRGMEVVAMLSPPGPRGGPLEPATLRPAEWREDTRALAIYVGGDLDRGRAAAVDALVQGLRAKEPGRRRPLTGDVVDELRNYSRKLDLVGASRFPIFSTLDLDAYQRWLARHRQLAVPGSVFWTWIQTHAPEDYARIVYDQGAEETFQFPIGPQPEQIKLMTYASLAAGYRGIVYSSDRALSESAQGRDRMLQLALLNLELSLIEPFLSGGKSPSAVKTSNPAVNAAVFSHDRGRLVIPYWKGADSQYVVGQAAINDLQLVVESAPEAAQAYQVSLGEVRGVKRMKDLGGVRLIVPEFDLSALLLLTTDMGLVARYQELATQLAPQAAAWSAELAEIQLARVQEVSARLESLGRGLPRARAMLEEAGQLVGESRAARAKGDHRSGVLFADRGRRVLRALMSEYFAAARKDLPSPAADPFAVSFYTLPEHYLFQEGLKGASFGDNKLPTGDFEREGNLDGVGWLYRPRSGAEHRPMVTLVGENPHGGRRSLEIKVESTEEQPPAAVDFVRVEMVSPPVPVRTGQVARISGFVRLPKAIHTSVDGAMIWDSLGGETLALRVTQPGDWQPFVLHRPVRRNGDLRVHLVLTGLGNVYFDDVKVELADGASPPIAGKREVRALR